MSIRNKYSFPPDFHLTPQNMANLFWIKFLNHTTANYLKPHNLFAFLGGFPVCNDTKKSLPVCGVCVWDEVPVQHEFLDNFLPAITRLQTEPSGLCHLTWKRTEWSLSAQPRSGSPSGLSKMSVKEAECPQFCSLPGSANENADVPLSSSLEWRLTVNNDFLIWLMLQRMTEGK